MPRSSAIEQDLEQAIQDPVFSKLDFPLRRTFYPLGFALELTTNSKDVIEASSESWGSYSQVFDEAPVRFQLGVAPGDAAMATPSRFRSRGHLMSMIASPDNFVMSDFNTGCAFGWVTEPVAANHPALRYRFLTSTVSMLLEHRALATIHSALIGRNGHGVMLCGDSTSGKSTLAYACARAGWTFVTDDGTYLVRKDPGRYAIGAHHTIRFRNDARRLFPELSDRLPAIRPNGKMAIEIFTRELPITTALGCSIDHVVFLNRNEPGPARLRRYPKERMLAWCEQTVSFGTAEVRAAQLLCHERLAAAGIWELCYQDFESAIPRLEQLVDSGG
ncbi:MAG TPA: hypothetical protein VGV35_18840 [Bryobacteraceae bacterium]|nr:hypothetical protein [Bryobacteraceae bacterium]